MRLFHLDRYSPSALLTWTALFWAGNMVVGRAIAGAMSPIALAYWRWVLVGVLFVVARGHPRALRATAPNPGDLIMLIALFLWGFYAVLLRYRPAQLSALGHVFVTGLIGLVIATPFFVLDQVLGAYATSSAFSWQALAAIGYFALFPTLAATVCYNHAVDRIGPVPASLFIPSSRCSVPCSRWCSSTNAPNGITWSAWRWYSPGSCCRDARPFHAGQRSSR